MGTKIPNVDTMSSLIDRLCIEVGKISFFENKKAEEHKKESPNKAYIADLDFGARAAGENRAAIKAAIDQLFKESIESGTYNYIKESRTF